MLMSKFYHKTTKRSFWFCKKIADRISITFLILSFFGSGIYAQNISVSYNSTAQPDAAFTVCGAAETNSLKISNGNGTAITGVLATLRIPTGGVYVVGSISGATESNISNLNAPVFNLPNIPSSNNTTITYQIMYGCGVIAYQNGGGLTKETIDFTYNGGGIQNGVTTPSTYNVIAAALSITSLTNLSFNGNVGSSFTQTATIVNGGLGCTNSAYIKLSNAGGSFSFSNPSLGIISNDTLFLNTALMPGGDGLWCNGESLTVSFTTSILDCNNLNRSTYVGWGCGGSSCQTSTPINSNVIINNTTPNLKVEVVNPNYDYCWRGEAVKQTFRIVNTGAGTASNIKLSVRSFYPNAFQGYNYFDTSLTWEVRNRNNTPIGAISNFTNLVPFTTFLNSNCTNVTRYYSLTGNLNPSLVLLAGDTLYLDVYSSAYNFACNPNACRDVIGWFGIQTQLDYKNQCGQGSYQEPYKGQVSRAYTELVSALNVATDVVGGQQFNLEVDWKVFNNQQHPNGSGSTIIAIPLAGTDLLPAASSITFAGYNFPMNVVNDTLFIGPAPQNITRSAHMTIPLQAICGNGGTKTINFFVLSKYSSCSPVVKIGCRTVTTTIHCPTPCPKGGATPVKFSLNRINYGIADNNNDGKPDASGAIDLSKINDHHSVNGDTLRGTWNIKVNPNVDPLDANFNRIFTNTYIDFSLGGTLGSAGTLIPLPNAVVTIYPVSNGTPIYCTVTPTIIGTKAHYDFSACKSTWEGGDSMVVAAKYVVAQTNASNYNKSNVSGLNLFVSNNEVYSTYSPQATPTTAPIANTTYTCDHFNDYNEISKIWLSPYIAQGQVITGCAGTINSHMRYYTRYQEGGLIFPYEYRNFFVPDTMAVQIPTGFVYRSNSGVFSGTNFPSLISLPNNNVYQVGDTLYFTGLKNYFTSNGGAIIPGDETASYTVSFNVNPTCAAVSGSYTGSTNTSGLGNGLNTPSNDYHLNNIEPVSPRFYISSPAYIYKAPQAILAGGGTVVTNTGAASWTMQLQNLANDASAANAYFYISPVNSFTNIIVKEGATVIAPDANGFYRLGDLLASTNRNFTINADLGRCGLDSFRIYFGNSCSGSYPNTFSAQPCQQFSWFKANGFPAALDVTFDRTPSSGTVGLCTPFSLEALINSNLVGNLDNEVYKVILPPNVSYINGSVQTLFPVGTSYTASLYNPSVIFSATGDTLVFAVNSLTGGIGLTGVGDLTRNQVKIKFDAQTTCGYISGSSAKAIITGTSVCGDPTATVVKTSSGVSLTGANPTTQYQITESGANSVSTCSSAQTYTFTVKNTGTTPPPPNDSLTINLSNGLSYITGSLVGIHNAPSPTAPVIKGNLLRWRIPSTVAPGDSMKFTINLAANSLGCGQNTMDIYATQSIVLSCGGNPCSTPVIVGRLISDTITTICCVDMQISKTVSPNPVVAGATAVYTIAVTNLGPGTATNVVVNDVLPSSVSYVSNTTTAGTWSSPDWTIPTMLSGQSDTIRFTVIANNSATTLLTVGNIAYVKSIDNSIPEINRVNDTSSVILTINPNCTGVTAGIDQTACSNTSATIAGSNAVGIWTASGTNPTGASLGVTVTGLATVSFTQTANGNYDFIFTDGSCKDTMRIEVTAKPNAGIDKSVVCYITDAVTMAGSGTGIWSAQTDNPGTATITSPTSATTTITNFSIAGTYNFIFSNNGCTDTVTVIVGSACTCPIANNAISTISSIQCAPYAGLVIDGSTATPSANTSYQWIMNIGFGWVNASGISTAEDYSTGGLSAGIYQYRRIFIHSGVPVCRDTTASITVTVNAKPNAGIDITGICGGYVLPLIGASSGGTWSAIFGNPTGASLVGSTVTFTNQASGIYNYVYSNSGCSDTVAITVNSKPSAGSDVAIECGSGTSNITVTGSPVGGVWTALSSNATGVTLGATINGVASINLPTAPAQGIWSFVYTANGCADTMLVTIGVNGNPSPSLNMGTNPICANGVAQLCPSNWGWSNYQWYKNGVAIASPIGTGSCITLDSTGAGSYSLAGQNSAGCWSIQSSPIIVSYNANCNGGGGTAPTCNISASIGVNSLIQCATNNSYQFTGNVTGGTAPFTYLWDLNDGTTATTKNVTHSYATHGEHDVTFIVRDANGCTANASTVQIYIGARPAGSFSLNDHTGNGSGISYSSTSTIGNGWMTHQWNLGNGTTSTLSNPGPVYYAEGTYTVTMIVTGNIATGIACSDTVTRTIIVGADGNLCVAPVAPSAITGTTAVTVGNSTTLASTTTGGVWSSSNNAVATVNASTGVVTGVSAGTATITYTVSNSCGSASRTQTILVSAACVPTTSSTSVAVCSSALPFIWNGVSYNSAGTYSRTFVNGNATGCDSTATLILTVNSAPAQPAAISGSSSIIVGNSTTLSSATAGGVWTSGNTAIATVNPSTGVVTGVATGSVTITYTVTNSCGSNNSNLLVTVNTACVTPVADFTVNTATLCISGNSFVFTNTTIGTVSGYTWNFGDGSSTATSPTHTYAAAGTYTVTLNAASGCGGSSKSMSVTVLPSQVVPVISGTTGMIVGGTTTLSATPAGGVWRSSNTAVATVNASTGVITGVTAGNASITYTVTGTCGTASASTSVSVNCNLQASFTINNASQCVTGNNFVYTSNVTGGVAPYNYAWSFHDGSVATTVNPTKVYGTYGEGNVQLQVTDSRGCVATATPVRQVVGAQPTAIFSVINNTGTGTSKTFISSSTIPAGSMSYAWNFGNGQTSTLINPTVSFVPGNYTVSVVVTGNGGCAATATQSITQTITSTVNIYPNPVMGQVEVSFRSASVTPTTVQILDLSGRLIQTQTMTPAYTGQLVNANFNMGGLQSGSYVIKIVDQQNGVLATKTMLKQ
jgi:uncharacterized repeat protein (TIGR01451 family)